MRKIWFVSFGLLVLMSGLLFGSASSADADENVLAVTPGSDYVLYTTSDGNLYINGIAIGNQLKWERNYYFNYQIACSGDPAHTCGAYTTRNQSIVGKVADLDKKSIRYGSYSSTYTGEVPHAFEVIVDRALYSYFYSHFEGGPNTIHEIDQTDITGKGTPRYTDAFDSSVRLIINADTGTVVDFSSPLNFYYGKNIERYSSSFQPVNAMNLAVPLTPNTVSTNPSDKKITISWAGSLNATKYEIESNGTIIGSTSTTTYEHAGLNTNTAYSYRVRAINSKGTSEWSDPVSTQTLLTIPSVTVSSTNDAILLKWNAIENASNYEIEVDGSVMNNGNNTSYNHTNLAPNTAHTYKVRAKNDTNASNWTPEIKQQTKTQLPTNLTAVATSSAVTLTWNAAIGATGYDIEVDGTLVTTNALTYTKSGLTPNTSHSFRIRAKNNGGVTEWTPMTTLPTLLATPTLTPSATTNSITITWPEIAGASGYEVEADGQVIDNGSYTSFAFMDLVANTNHTFKARAKNDNNTSAWTTVITKSTAPVVPTNLSNTMTNTSVTLNWTAVTGATGYDVEVDGVIGSTSSLTYTKNGLAANSNHTFRIRAKNSGGASDWTSALNVQTLLNTPVMSLVSTSDSITLTWPAVTDASGYDVEIDGSVMNNGTDTSYSHKNLTASTAHTYRVRAKTATNLSQWTTLTTRSTAPLMPTNVTSTATNTSLTVTWPAVAGAAYDVEVDGIIATGVAVPYTKTGLAANTPHTFRVRSKNNSGASEWTTTINALTLLNTPVVTSASTSDAMTLTWADVKDATGYELEFDGAVINNGTSTNFIQNNLTANTSHTYKVRAISSSNASAWTNLITKYTAPITPTKVSSISTSTYITLSWTAVPGATGYDVEVDGIINAVSTAEFTKYNLPPNTTHTFRVRSKNSGGVSEWTNSLNVLTPLSTPVVNSTATSDAITLNWVDIKDATGYELEFDGAVINNGANTSFIQSNLTANTSHTYKVRAISSSNASAWTTLVTKYTAPVVPTNVNLVATSSYVTLSWTAVNGATGYEAEFDGVINAVSSASFTKINLPDNSTHTFRVRSKNTGGVSEWTNSVNVQTLLNTPVVNSTATSNAIMLNWADIKDATGYDIEVDGTVIDNGTNTNYTHSNLTPNTTHTYKVRARTSSNASVWTTILTKYTAPIVPTNLSNTATNISVNLSWTAVAGATAYDIEIDGVVVNAGSAANYTKTNLLANTSHTFRIRAKNTGGVSDWTNLMNVQTLLNTPVLSSTATSTSIFLNWIEIKDATSYEVEVDGTIIDNSVNTTYTHSNLTASTAHNYRVRAKSAFNASAWTAILAKYTAPLIPTNLTYTATNTSVTLNWTAAAGATAYEVEVDGSIVSSSASVNYTKTNLIANTSHTFRIRAKNTGGVSEWTNLVNAQTLLNTPVMSLVSTSDSITLTWPSVTDASGYDMEIDGSVIDNGTDTSYSHKNLTASTAHTYRVRAKTATNLSQWTTLTTKYTAPLMPTNVTSATTNTSLTLTWPAVAGAASYEVDVDGVIASGVTTPYTKSGLVANTSHTFRIRSKNSGGFSDWTTSINVLTLLNNPVVTSAATSDAITLTWADVKDATGYEVEFDGAVINNGASTNFTQNNLNANTSHTYRVRAISSSNTGAWTNLITKYTAPITPTKVSSTSTSTNITLSWTAVPGATGYEVEVDGIINAVSTAEFTKYNLPANTSHTFRVRSKNNGGVSEWTTVQNFSTLLTTPVATVTAAKDSITLTWGAIADATSYEIEVDGVVNDIGTDTSYTQQGLSPNTTHKYRIRAKGGMNYSNWTSVISKNTLT
ncbi:hypothetical protein J2Z69_002969 [Paenibacillus shirakamiensis]|uniref:Fibronectin type-III domain-containing protein n=1 Tax=Paenibacillus shirakamiensis TaxID=1265935 RepID=A0ABS4JJN3_9BACL|nr:fibronectin type III domain-containing protein [Paenibacillus shirakamiensis]MBP2001913.1 hypothetical protein [Paenibacillus shirakamiensis]